MLKINPIKSNIVPDFKNFNNKKMIKRLSSAPYAIPIIAIGATGIAVSSFFNGYNKTVNNNYFKLKKNIDTGLPYKPDVFQDASAMNLYLGNDVLVTAPTGTGKTAIAQYVITKNLNEGYKTFYTTPLKALSNEKYRDFCKTYGDKNVGLITGDTKININAPIILMTTEVYRNMAATDIFKTTDDTGKGIPLDLKTVIFDELQYLGDIDRGGIWEQSIMFTPKDVQILSLSATIGNNEEINKWIASVKGNKAVSITPNKNYKPKNDGNNTSVLINVPSENRHVPLNYEVYRCSAEIKKMRGGSKKQKVMAKKEALKNAQSLFAKVHDDTYKILTKNLMQEDKLPAIYFVFSKKKSRKLLKLLSTESEILTTTAERNEIARIIKEEYLDKDIYLGEGLNTEALLKGYAVHNAGLLPTQKKLIEELFQKKLLKVVIATETLSAGINMPARTTVISSPRKITRFFNTNDIQQMAGRAGRRGIDDVGYCYLLSCNPMQSAFYEEKISSQPNELESNLKLDYSFIVNMLSENFDELELESILSKSLFVFDGSETYDKTKLKEIIEDYKIKKDILLKLNFIDSNGKLTAKGEMLKGLNGYEQLPIINLLASKILSDIEPEQLAGLISGVANIEYEELEDLPDKPIEIKRKDDTRFDYLSKFIINSINEYNKIIKPLNPQVKMSVNADAMDHVYTWAEFNLNNANSRKNWKSLYTGELKMSIPDEGTLFKEITMTTDLLKQLIEITKIAENKFDVDYKYYHNLSINLRKALELIQKEPIVEH